MEVCLFLPSLDKCNIQHTGSQNVWVLRHDDHTHELVTACLINDKYVMYNSLLYCTFEVYLFSLLSLLMVKFGKTNLMGKEKVLRDHHSLTTTYLCMLQTYNGV